MALMEMGVRTLTNRLPKVIGPKTHAIIDYGMAASFFIVGGLLWKKSKRAAISSFICGGSELTTAMLTDYPGGIAKAISFPTHGRIDAGFAGVIASMPNLMGFSDRPYANFFRGQGLGMAAVTGLTDFEGERESSRDRRFRRVA
jgi:hypothetical protein